MTEILLPPSLEATSKLPLDLSLWISSNVSTHHALSRSLPSSLTYSELDSFTLLFPGLRELFLPHFSPIVPFALIVTRFVTSGADFPSHERDNPLIWLNRFYFPVPTYETFKSFLLPCNDRDRRPSWRPPPLLPGKATFVGASFSSFGRGGLWVVGCRRNVPPSSKVLRSVFFPRLALGGAISFPRLSSSLLRSLICLVH